MAIPSARPHLQSGALKALAISTANKALGYVQIPPIAETFPGFDFSGWLAVVAPSGAPNAVVERLNGEIDAVLKQADIVARLREVGFYTSGAGTVEEVDEFMKSQLQSWGALVKLIGIQLE